jgi:hypothetical protein
MKTVLLKKMWLIITLFSFVRNLGASLGLAIASTLMCVHCSLLHYVKFLILTDGSNNSLRAGLRHQSLSTEEIQEILDSPASAVTKGDDKRAALLQAYRNGFRLVFLVGASLAAFAFFATYFLIPHCELKRPDDVQKKEEAKSRLAEKYERKTHRKDKVVGIEPVTATSKTAEPV